MITNNTSGRLYRDWINPIVDLRLLACCDCGFESRREHRCLSVVSVVCCQVEVSATGDHSSRGVLPSVACLSVIIKPWQWEDLLPPMGCWAMKKWWELNLHSTTRLQSLQRNKVIVKGRSLAGICLNDSVTRLE